MVEYKEAIRHIYSEKENLVILGLTGRTGSGCTTVAEVLGRKKYELLDVDFENNVDFSITENYKQKIIATYMKDYRWQQFTIIELSNVILSYIFEMDSKTEFKSDLFIKYLTDLQNHQEGANFQIKSFNNLVSELKGMNYLFEEVQKYPLDQLGDLLQTNYYTEEQKQKIKEYYTIYIEKFEKFKIRFKDRLLKYTCFEEKKSKMHDEPPVKFHLYTYIMQKIGNNVRASGNPYESKLNQNAYLEFGKRIELHIELIRVYDIIQGQKSRICVETIRNPFEASYLKDRYRAFWLMSINTDDASRVNRLTKHLDRDQLKSLDSIEYPKSLNGEEMFYHQNICSCLEMADIHILNNNAENNKYFFLTSQLLKYISLMLHPGLITPTAIERCMQLAYNAKYNSGCLSRQVGAVITGEDFSIKAVGWNDVPKGQISCNLRDVHDFCTSKNCNRYSDYEITDKKFEETIKNIDKQIKYDDLDGRLFPYCFKDIYNGMKKDTNQVHTRSLHAEENAFLQISKYGGGGIKDGFLFTTASPCELCAKKAYQLGISEIYYIDPYPGISQNHILKFGKGWNPKMKLFYGAIGEAYISLYKPRMSYKDELSLLTGIKPKLIAGNDNANLENQIDPKDLHYNNVENEFTFFSRENMVNTRDIKFKIIKGSIKSLERNLTWTGSSYDGTSSVEEDPDYKIVNLPETKKPFIHLYSVVFNDKKIENDTVSYKIQTDLKDEAHLMHPYLAHMVKHPIDRLKIKLTIPKNADYIENVVVKRYADLEMKTEYNGKEKLLREIQGDQICYSLEVINPLLFYSYSIEWEWKKLVVENEV